MKLAMGQYNVPQKQKQPVFYLDLYRNNVAIFGSAMTGKTVFIKTLLVQIDRQFGKVPFESIYIIDFGGNIGKYSELRNVCCCVDTSNEENVRRVFKTICSRLNENQEKLQSQNYYGAVAKNPRQVPGHMTLIIENINAFLGDERYANYLDLLIQLCRDGLSKGLTVIITGNDMTGMGRLLSYFSQKIAFELPPEVYVDIFDTKVDRPMPIPGRGLLNCEYGICEYQCFLPFPDQDDASYIAKLTENKPQQENPYRIEQFPKILTWENLRESCCADLLDNSGKAIALVGLDYYEHRPVEVNFDSVRSIAIYGKRNFGKLNLLHLLLYGIRKNFPGARYVFLDDGRKRLEEINSSLTKGEEIHRLNSVAEFRDFLVQMHYISKKNMGMASPSMRSEEEPQEKKTPFTVFVLQSKALYRNSVESKQLLTRWLPNAVAEAESKGYLIIFSDVPHISEADMRSPFNDNIALAFLLDNIAEFLGGRGSRSVLSEAFSSEDIADLKAAYAKCMLGDGYMYDTGGDELKKIKFIKTS